MRHSILTPLLLTALCVSASMTSPTAATPEEPGGTPLAYKFKVDFYRPIGDFSGWSESTVYDSMRHTGRKKIVWIRAIC